MLYLFLFLPLKIKRLFFKFCNLLHISYWNNNEVIYEKNNKEVDESTFTIKELITLSEETKDSVI